MALSPADDRELADVAALVNGAYRGGQGWTHEGEHLAGERTSAAALRADLAAQAKARLLVWRDADDGPLLGCVWLEAAGEAVWYLGLLTVRPDLQDRRLGRELLEAAEGLAIDAGARRMRMTVVNVRDTLIAWYQRRGYQPTGEVLPFPYGDNRFGEPRRDDLSFVVLEKPLRP